MPFKNRSALNLPKLNFELRNQDYIVQTIANVESRFLQINPNYTFRLISYSDFIIYILESGGIYGGHDRDFDTEYCDYISKSAKDSGLIMSFLINGNFKVDHDNDNTVIYFTNNLVLLHNSTDDNLN